VTAVSTTERADTVTLPSAQLLALLDLMEAAADLRDREVRAAYEAGYLAGTRDPAGLRLTWEAAWQVAQDRLVLDLQDGEVPEPVQRLTDRRRAQLAEWVRTGRAEDYPYPGRAA
jgi:hypothetical protein